MAGNGGDLRQMEKLEQALTGPRSMAPAPTAEGTADDVMTNVAAMAQLCRELGRYAREHGQFIGEICEAFARQEEERGREFAERLLAAEERKMGELRRFMGKLK